MKFLNGYLFLMDSGGYQEGYEDRVLKQLVMKAKFYKCQKILVEPNFGNGMFAQLLTPVVQDIYNECAVEDSKSAKGQKEARIIDTLEPVMMRHKLIVDRRVIDDDYKVYEKDPQYSLIYQLTRLSRDRGSLGHDDRLDALEMAVSYWLDCLSINETQGIDDLNYEQLEKWLDPDYGVLYKEEAPNQQLQRVTKSDFNLTSNALDSYLFRH